MSFIRSLLHLLWMAITVVPYAVAILLAALLGVRGEPLYRIAAAWLKVAIQGAHWILGIQSRVMGMENLPQAPGSKVILLLKHQSTYETFLMPTIMPRPLAYVFKKELLQVPFFGWAMGRLDMIHIDRRQRTQAFHKVVQQGQDLMEKGVWVIMFPEGTRIPRGEKGVYKTGGGRLAVETGVPVIPIAVTSAKCWPRRALFNKKPGIVDVSIGPAIAVEGRSAEDVMQEVENWIEAEMHRLDPEAYAKKPA